MGKTKVYHVFVLLWTFLQLVGWIVLVALGVGIHTQQPVDGGSIAFFWIVAPIFLAGGSALDIVIRGVKGGTLIEKILLTILVSPIRWLTEIITLVMLSKKSNYGYYGYQRGNYTSDRFLNRLFYILNNRSAGKDLGPKPKTKPLTPEEKEKLNAYRKEREEKERLAKEEKDRIYKEKVSKCNMKLVLYGRYGDDDRFWDGNFLNRGYTGDGIQKKSYDGTYMDAFFVESLKIDGVKVNAKHFSSHVNFYLTPGVNHTVEAKVYYSVHIYNCKYPTNPPVELPSGYYGKKSYCIAQTVSCNINPQSGYRYHLGLFASITPYYTEYKTRSGQWCYSWTDGVNKKLILEPMGEKDVYNISKAKHIDNGIFLEDIK